MTEAEPCPEFKEYTEWYSREVQPQLKKFYAHIINCPECLKKMLSAKDELGLRALTVSDEEFIRLAKDF